MNKMRTLWAVVTIITILCLGWLPRGVSAQATPTGVWKMKWSPDGEHLAIADWNSLVYVLDASGIVRNTLSGHSRRATSVAWSPNGEILVTGGPDDRFVNLWNSGTGELINQIPSSIDALYDGVFGLAWSPGGAHLIATSFDTFQFWETTSWTALEPSRGGTLYDVEWSPDGSLLAVTDIYFLSFFNGQTLISDNLENDVIQSEGDNPEQISWSADSAMLATTDRLDARVSIWHVPTRTRIGVLNTTGPLFKDVVFIGSEQIAAVTEAGTLYILDTTASVLATFETGVIEARSLAWNPQLQLFAIGGAQTLIDDNGITGLPLIALGDVLASTSSGTTITVTTTADENGTGANCSLREAITAANTNAAFGGCSAGSGDDTILVPEGFYRVNSELVISSAMTINGVDPNLTRIAAATAAGGANYRVLNVAAGGDLTLIDTGVYFGGNASVPFGGGIYVQADVHLSTNNVVIARNTAQFGGGLALQGTAQLANTVIRLNQATTASAALGVDGASASVTLFNVGMAENTSAGGGGAIGVSNGATVSGSRVGMINNTAPLGGGGALVQDHGSALTLTSSIIEFNTGASGSAVMGATGAVVSITNSCIVGNQADPAVRTSVGSASMTFTDNWWGAAIGPDIGANLAPTTGDSVDSSVNYADFLTIAPANCGVCPSLNLANGRSARLCRPPVAGYPQPLNAGDGTP